MSPRTLPSFSRKSSPNRVNREVDLMRRWTGFCWVLVASALLLLTPIDVFAQTTIDKAVLDRVKDATAYIKIKAGKLQGSGSGFVFKNLNGRVLVMTNRHVAVPEADEIEPGTKVELSAVFRSGTSQEQEVPAKLVAYSRGEAADLAVLEVTGLRDVPAPISADLPVTESEMYETMPAYAIGFPLGGQIQQIAGNVKQNPAVTVNAMTISSLRRDESSMLARIQLAGSIIGGNSGGPVVDVKGRLLGVVVSRLVGENVGFAVPPVVISSFLSGGLGEPLLVEVLRSVGPDTQLKIVWRISDPLSRASAFGVSFTHKPIAPDGFKRVSGPSSGFPLLPDAKPMKMMRDGDLATITFALPINRTEDRKIHLQFVLFDFTGNIIGSSIPLPLTIPDRPGRIFDADQQTKAKQMAMWSCETNLSDGVKMHHKPGTTTIDLPAGLPLNNAPQYDLFNAPCALVKVDGDFLTSVEVGNTFDPGGEGVMVPNGKRPLPFSFQSAGLLIWQDERNFVRFERNKRSDGKIAMTNQILVEVYKNGKSVAVHYLDIREQEIALAAIRRGGTLTLYFALPPDKLAKFYDMAIDFRKDVFVGVAAANLSKREFHAKLEDFRLTTPEGQPIEAKPYKMAKLVDSGFTKLPDGTQVYEGATMRAIGRNADSVAPQTDMANYKGSWSDNRQLLWSNDKPDGVLSIELPVESDGKYEIKAKLTLGPDYGIAKIDLEGKPFYKGGKIDFYSPEVRPTSLLSMGTFSLNKGKRKLNITIFKKNAKSTGYHIGIDEIQLVPVK